MAGNDTLYGGDGNDDMQDWVGAPDFDTAYGGPGNDTINVQDGDHLDVVCTGSGKDTVKKDGDGLDGDAVDADAPECSS